MLPPETPALPAPEDTQKSHRWVRWLVHFLSWGSVMGVATGLFASMLQQEERIRARALTEAAHAQQTWQQWEIWHLPEPIEGGMAHHPPLEPELGRQLLRTTQLKTQPVSLPPALWERLEASPFLVRYWYNRVQPETLLTGELSLRSRSQGPSLQLKRRIALRASDVLMLDAEVAELLTRRCPTGCPQLSTATGPTQGDGEALALILTALLDDPDLTTAFEALDLLLSAQENAIPLLEARLERPAPQSGQALAFMGLSQLYDETRRRALLNKALAGPAEGLRILALLEVLRTGDASIPLPPEVAAGIPAGEVLRQYVLAEVERAAPDRATGP